MELERMLQSERKNPDRLSSLFIQVTDDLSYSRTFYQNRSIRVYLNNIAQQLFYNVYKNRKIKKSTFINFWTESLPAVVYTSYRELLIALLLFVLAMTIGIVSSVHDPNFSRTILGDGYVQMTMENIESGDPMAVYKKMNELDMFFGITLNNLRVSFRTFILGIFFSIGSAAILFYNGIMVGTFQYFFIERGLFRESFLTIWLHGTIEISCIILAGAAGLILGKGLVFPGTYTRLQAMQVSARKGLKLFLGIVPLIVLAATIESFFTRYTEAPDALRLLVIVGSLAFILFYFVLYPYVKFRNRPMQSFMEKRSTSSPEEKIEFYDKIRNNSDIFKELFLYGKGNFTSYIRIALISTLVYVPIVFFVFRDYSGAMMDSYQIWFFQSLPGLMDYATYPILYFVNSLYVSVNLYAFYLRFSQRANEKSVRLFFQGDMALSMLFSVMLLNLPLFAEGTLCFLLILVLYPLIFFTMGLSFIESRPIYRTIGRSYRLLLGNIMQLLGVFALLGFISFLLFFAMSSPLIAFYLEVIQWNISAEFVHLQTLMLLINLLTSAFGFTMILPIIAGGLGFQYFSFREINEAKGLHQLIARI